LIFSPKITQITAKTIKLPNNSKKLPFPRPIKNRFFFNTERKLRKCLGFIGEYPAFHGKALVIGLDAKDDGRSGFSCSLVVVTLIWLLKHSMRVGE
jgi:hypothetical protein